MRFLVDECCPVALVRSLQAAGFDTVYVAEEGGRSVDVALLSRGIDERRIVVTEDFDFGDLLFRDLQPSAGVIILFLPDMAPGERADRLLELLGQTAFDASGHLTIVEAKGFRQRLLPPSGLAP